MDLVDLLRRLSEASGVSGYEDSARSIAQEAFGPYVDEIRTDALGNLIALRRGTPTDDVDRHSIMLAAHTDEIGLMVSGLEKGFIRFERVGGVDVRTIVGQEVVVHGRQDLPGIIASHPPHVVPAEERKKAIPLEKLFVDVGLPADRLEALVRVGDLITMHREFTELADGFACGKAFDDRAGVASLAVCLEALSGLQHAWDVYAVATSQEELGLRGATVSAYGIAPGAAIAVDVGFGKQQGMSEEDTLEMDGGPAVAIGPNIHPLMQERLTKTAQEYEMKHQVEYAPGRTGTDAWAIQVARDGIPTALLSIPLRYMHTTVETVCLRDITRTGRLMAFFIAGLDQQFAEEMGV